MSVNRQIGPERLFHSATCRKLINEFWECTTENARANPPPPPPSLFRSRTSTFLGSERIDRNINNQIYFGRRLSLVLFKKKKSQLNRTLGSPIIFVAYNNARNVYYCDMRGFQRIVSAYTRKGEVPGDRLWSKEKQEKQKKKERKEKNINEWRRRRGST